MSVHSPTAPSSRLLDVLPPLLFALCAAALFREALTGGQVYYQDDTVIYYVPLARRVASILAEGRLPLWTPWIFAGHPLFADSETAVLYPPNLVAWLLFSPYGALVATRMFRFFLAATFTWLLCRTLGMSRSAATLAGLSFGFGSFMAAQLHHRNLADCALWLPAVLWAIEHGMQVAGGSRLRWWLGGGLALGLQLLTIHINPVLMTLMAIGAYVPARVFLLPPRPPGVESWRDGLRVSIGALALVGVAGFGVAAVQLLPLYELSTYSFRGRQVDYGFANAFNFPPANLLTLVFPYFFRVPENGAYWSPWFRWNTTLYVGVAPFVLAVVALVTQLRRNRHALFFAGLALVGLLLALGANLPVNLYALVWQLPVFSSTRVPSRYLLFCVFGLAVLAGYGLDALGARRRSAAAAACAQLGFGLVLLAGPWVAEHRDAVEAAVVRPYATQPGQAMTFASARVGDHFAALLASLDPTSPWTWRGLVLLAAAAALLAGCAAAPRLRPHLRTLLVLVTAVDLVLFARDFHPRLQIEGVLATGPAVDFLAAHNDGMHRIVTQPNVWATAPNRLVPLRIPEANGYTSLIPDRHQAYMTAALQMNNHLLELMGVRYVVARRGHAPAPLASATPVFQDGGDVVIYERPTLPRAFVVGAAQLAPGGRNAMAALRRPDFDPAAAVVVEDGAAADGLAHPGSAGTAEIASYGSERVELHTKLTEPGLLVLTDTYYPGWRAYVDGEEAPVYRADFLFRGVRLPAGEHTVRFVFDPLSFKLGAGISLVTLIALAVAFTLTFRLFPLPVGAASRPGGQGGRRLGEGALHPRSLGEAAAIRFEMSPFPPGER